MTNPPPPGWAIDPDGSGRVLMVIFTIGLIFPLSLMKTLTAVSIRCDLAHCCDTQHAICQRARNLVPEATGLPVVAPFSVLVGRPSLCTDVGADASCRQLVF